MSKYIGTLQDENNDIIYPRTKTSAIVDFDLSDYRTAAEQDEIDDAQDTAINDKESKGKITISGVEKTANTHTVTIVTDGVTSTFTLVGVS